MVGVGSLAKLRTLLVVSLGILLYQGNPIVQLLHKRSASRFGVYHSVQTNLTRGQTVWAWSLIAPQADSVSGNKLRTSRGKRRQVIESPALQLCSVLVRVLASDGREGSYRSMENAYQLLQPSKVYMRLTTKICGDRGPRGSSSAQKLYAPSYARFLSRSSCVFPTPRQVSDR